MADYIVADELNKSIANLASAYSKVEAKGGTLPTLKNGDNLPMAIESIPTGGAPSDDEISADFARLKAILAENQRTDYPYSYIIEVADWDIQTAFNATTTNAALGGQAFLTSDGSFYVGNVTAHVWDKSKDISNNRGFKTRWIVIYRNTRDFAINVRNFPCRYLVFDNANIASLTAGYNSTPYNTKLIGINITENTLYGASALVVNAFNNCHSLSTIYMSSGLTSIPSGAFINCYSLTSINIPISVTSIHPTAFNYCYSLTSIVIPSFGTTTGYATFYNCYALTFIGLSINFNINSMDFSSCILSQSSFIDMANKVMDRTGLAAYTMTFGATQLARMPDEVKAIFVNKNWTLA